MQPTRVVTLEPARPVHALTATARGMIERTFVRAAQRAFTELMTAIGQAGHMDAVRSCVGLLPDVPAGPDDARCRYVAGVIFGHDLATGEGACLRPPVPLSGSLAWTMLAPGRHAVFSHVGPYDTLHAAWKAIREQWLPASGLALRDAPPLELTLSAPGTTAPEALRTELWLPVADR